MSDPPFASVTSTTSFGYYTISWSGTHYTDCTYTENNTIKNDEYYKKIKKLIREQRILAMKRTWRKDQKEYKPSPIRKPVLQLHNICLNGQGWA